MLFPVRYRYSLSRETCGQRGLASGRLHRPSTTGLTIPSALQNLLYPLFLLARERRVMGHALPLRHIPLRPR